jgi:hypothetical protein
LESAFSFAAKWGAVHLKNKELPVPTHTILSSSSCREVNRSKGGNLAHLITGEKHRGMVSDIGNPSPLQTYITLEEGVKPDYCTEAS